MEDGILFSVYKVKQQNVVFIEATPLCRVEQLVEALRYNPEGRGFDSRWCYWNFSLT